VLLQDQVLISSKVYQKKGRRWRPG
jgi:hypothetical protein